VIHLQGVSRHYQDGTRRVYALEDVALRVEAGETVALVGRSGSGKSTLLHLVGGLEWPSTGEVTVAGQPLHRLGDEALTQFRLRHIGFVFQFFHLLPALSVMENLLLPAELAGVSVVEAGAKARRLLDAVGLGSRTETLPERLSGGEQQRVAVARALMLDPPILLADEPIGNLDSETGESVLALMVALARERGTTVVMATHSPELPAAFHRRINLRDGRIVEDTAVNDASGAATDATHRPAVP